MRHPPKRGINLNIAVLSLSLCPTGIRLLDRCPMKQDVILFPDALERAGDTPSLLLGNGFSADYFSYRSLLAKADLKADDPVRLLFDRMKTVDFERVVKALEIAAGVERAYGKDAHADELEKDAGRLREALVHAIRETHPAHPEAIAERIPSCLHFLSSFGNIFTLNYDLLLNWVGLAKDARLTDGFGLGDRRNGFLGPFRPDAYCNVFNLHGGLHLFRDGPHLQKRLAGDAGVIDAIAKTITTERRLPLYVAEGASPAKLERIRANAYLSHCYDVLGDCSGSMFVFGHSADPNDAHIYSAIFRSKVDRLFFCVYQPTEERLKEINGELARYKARAGSKVDVTFVDSESAKVWNSPEES